MIAEITQFDICSGNMRVGSIIFNEKTKTYIWRTRDDDLKQMKISVESYQSKSLRDAQQCLNDAIAWFKVRTGLNIAEFHLKQHKEPKQPKKEIDLEPIKSMIQTTEIMVEIMEKQLTHLKKYLKEVEKAS